jgi:hypothetical protein
MKMWAPAGEMEIIDLENDYFLIRLEDRSDVARVFEGGPWLILGHHLVIQRWHPKFFPKENELKRVAVWIRIPGLPIEYYDKHILWRIGSCIGRTVKIDANTLKSKKNIESKWHVPERGKFARICVEIDLRKILRSKFILNKRTYTVEYEGLNLVCFSCGRYGHRKEQCPEEQEKDNGKEAPPVPANIQTDQAQAPSTNNEQYGPWMLVQRNNGRRRQNIRQPPDNHREALITGGQIGNNGSRFGALSNHYEDTTLNAIEGRDVPHANISVPINVEKQQERHNKSHRVRGTRNINMDDSSLVGPTLPARNITTGPILEPTTIVGDKEPISIRSKKQWAREGPISYKPIHNPHIDNIDPQSRRIMPNSIIPVPQIRLIDLNTKKANTEHGSHPPDQNEEHLPSITY